jgi:hypothetical protein
MWQSEKSIKDLNSEELKTVNLRKTRPNEIIFDVEDKISANIIKAKIENYQWSYEMWWTGSRGYHFSVLFTNLDSLDLELRNRLRKYYISELKTDEALAKESQFIALEYTPHFKTGDVKYLFEYKRFDFENIIDEKIIDYCRKDIEFKNLDKTVASTEDFTDFLKDSYLNYALTTVIVDGGRNDILFKNLAVGLVKCGLDDNTILKIAQKIVDNCPGKHVNEFMGWVRKVRDEDFNEYNKAELIQWAMQYGHPVYYNLFEEVDIETLMSIESLWKIIWNHRIIRQEDWGQLCYYNLISTVVQERNEDLRIHPIFSCQSGSGKDEGLNLVKEILDKLGLQTYKPATVTDKTLLGGINQTQLEINTKNNDKGKTDKNKDPRELGILADADWIGFGESETVFNPKMYNQALHVILRQAMDKSRTIEKGVGGLVLNLYTNATFAFTTYPVPNIIHKLLNNGLFQRAIYLDKKMTREDNWEIVKHINKMKYDETIKTNFNEEKYIALLVEKLKVMKLWYNENKYNFKFVKGTNDYVDSLWEKYISSYNILNETDADTLDSMVKRAATNLYKIMKLHAISLQSNEITTKDVDCAHSLITTSLDSVKNALLNVGREDKEITALLLILSRGDDSYGNILRQLQEKKIIKSTATLSKLIKKCEALAYINSYPSGKYTHYTVTQKGKEQIGIIDYPETEHLNTTEV